MSGAEKKPPSRLLLIAIKESDFFSRQGDAYKVISAITRLCAVNHLGIEMADDEQPSGELFSRIYTDRSVPLPDSQSARRRFAAYIEKYHPGNLTSLAEYLLVEAGFVVHYNGGYWYDRFFKELPLTEMLDSITLIWRYLTEQDREKRYNRHEPPSAPQWLAFARRVMSEENLSYRLDDSAGAHHRVDEEFERNRVSVLQCLEAPRYAGVRAAFEQAHQHLDPSRQDLKAAVRSMFEAVEILARLMTNARNLHKKLVETSLKKLALDTVMGDPTAITTVEHLSNGFAQWVDAVHNYRHGQGATEPIDPPIDLAIYILSSGASYLRWLVSIDSAQCE